MSKKTIIKDGKVLIYNYSVEEDHPEVHGCECLTLFEKAEKVLPGAMPEFIELSLLDLLRKCSSLTVESTNGHITVQDNDSEESKAVIAIDLADYIANAEKAKSVIVASQSEYNAALRGIELDGIPTCKSALMETRRAFLVAASGSTRLFDKVYVVSNFYTQTGVTEEFNYDAIGGKRSDFHNSYVCGVLRNNSKCVDAFLGVPMCNLDDITLIDGVVTLTFAKLFDGATGYMYPQDYYENTTVRIYLNPADFK